MNENGESLDKSSICHGSNFDFVKEENTHSRQRFELSQRIVKSECYSIYD